MARRRKKTPKETVEIDLHGYRSDEVHPELTDLVGRYEGIRGQQIRVVHGKGSGILESEVDRFSRNDPRVSSAEKDFFNPGVTILILNGRTGGGASSTRAGKYDHVGIPPIRKRKG